LQPVVPVPPAALGIVGNYYSGTNLLNISMTEEAIFAIGIDSVSNQIQFQANLTQTDFDELVFRVNLMGPEPICRWEDDGMDQELIYFDAIPASQVIMMEQIFTKSS